MPEDNIYELLVSKTRLPDFSFNDLPLLNALENFSDTGGAVSLSSKFLLDNLQSELVVKFDTDQLINYSANRSVLYFDNNQYSEYIPNEINIYAVKDSKGKYFLLLTGKEPDLKWNKFTKAMGYIATQFNITSFVSLNALPMGVPHTRPTLVTAHGNNLASLGGHHNLWNEKFQLPGNIDGLLELEFDSLNIKTYGFSAHVPHYLSQMEYYPASLALLENIAESEKLTLPLHELEDEARNSLANLEDQLNFNGDFKILVSTLEEQYDNYTFRKQNNPSLLSRGQRIPTGDELGDELEKYLAQEQDKDERYKYFNPDSDSDFTN